MKEPLQSPTDKLTNVNVRSGQKEVVITINCFLHPADHDRLLDHMFDFLKTCDKSIDWVERWNKGDI